MDTYTRIALFIKNWPRIRRAVHKVAELWRFFKMQLSDVYVPDDTQLDDEEDK